ncbi:MAG TPA: hypothetical protein VFA65_22805 [Bryobacteraceae bacterium]|nr:hypothetical protein [Bryobacteraceae bacterium]
MVKPPQPRTEEEVPLYIRWSPDRSAYSIELRLDLVSKIAAQVSISEQLGIELGGFLVGTFPAADVPTIRIDDIEMVSNSSADDTVFLPEPAEMHRLPEVRARARDLTIIGFFRTHARIGPRQPSLADRSIFAQEFKSHPYVVLLIQAKPPHTAAFFVASNGQLPQEPSVREFEFNEDEFKSLPEISAETPEGLPIPVQEKKIDKNRLRVFVTIAALLLIAISACALMWSFARQASLPQWFSSGNQLHLTVTSEDQLLRISWNHSASDLNQATSATLIITDGAIRSQVALGLDDLRLGSVLYQGKSSHVGVHLMLNTPNGQSLGDSAEWSGQP